MVKVMAQSCANIANDVILDLEKKIESICKGAPFYYNSLFKKMSSINLQNFSDGSIIFIKTSWNNYYRS